MVREAKSKVAGIKPKKKERKKKRPSMAKIPKHFSTFRKTKQIYSHRYIIFRNKLIERRSRRALRREKKRVFKMLKTKSGKEKKVKPRVTPPYQLKRRIARIKRKRLRNYKTLLRRRRRCRKLHASRHRYAYLKKKSKRMSLEDLEARLTSLDRKRLRYQLRHQKYKVAVCRPRRRAIKKIEWDLRRARHRKKKLRRYRRQMKRRAKKKYWAYRKKKHRRGAVKKRVPWKRRVRDFKKLPYDSRHEKEERAQKQEATDVVKVPVIKKGDKIMLLGTEPYMFRGDAIGMTGVIEGKGMTNRMAVDMRYTYQLTHNKTGTKETQFIALLSTLGSPNCIRMLACGSYLDQIAYSLTTRVRQPLEQLMHDHQNMDTQTCLYIMQQTYFCIRDAHRISRAHLNVCPASFSVLVSNPKILVFSDFSTVETLPMNREKPIKRRQHQKWEPLKQKKPGVYMSRAQHLNMPTGVADDYESWFYLCAKLLNKDALKWEKTKDTTGFKMLMSKYEFPAIYSHKDKQINEKMIILLKYVLVASEKRTNKVCYFIGKLLENWRQTLPEVKTLPWEKKGKEEPRKVAQPKQEE